ncbi:alcohol dehydrogenase [Vigna unguiculata]|uniref:Alcohol dehydrogenase n=1 Tax=Vigna unguiculata TaxID=3917 RepID=A0A4D6L4Y2_VIGUN|nr:alcohol dehydrogenase [Vigna unguiculata]
MVRSSKCKAAVAWEAGKPLVIEEVEVAHCKSEESNMCDLLRINTDRGVIIHDSQTRFSVKGQPIYHFVGLENPGLDIVCNNNVSEPKPGSSVAIFHLELLALLLLKGQGFPVIAVECTGSIQSMVSTFECVHDGWGVAVHVGVPSKDDAFKTHRVNFLNERTLKGTFYGNYKPRTDLPSVVEKYMIGELELEKFITHTVLF